jgi:rSAM/selenodomain-associated transferase 1
VPYKHPDTVILVFCKAPIAGQVKTRLMPELSAQQAVDVHIELTCRILSLLVQAQLCPIQLWCSPDIGHPFFYDCKDQYAVSLHRQQGQDLGERMLNAISTALQSFSNVLLVGCDCPSLTTSDFDFAIDALQSNNDNDIVIAPAEDGGYVMIAMKQAHPELFLNMIWGTQNVLRTTCSRISKLGLSLIQTTQQWDVDTVEDLQRFQSYQKPVKTVTFL